MSKLNVTKGKWIIDHSGTKGHIKAVGDFYDDKTPTVARYDIWSKHGLSEDRYGSEKDNAILIADAGTTFNKCSKLSSELLAENEELKAAIVELMRFKSSMTLTMHDALQYPDNFLKAVASLEELINK